MPFFKVSLTSTDDDLRLFEGIVVEAKDEMDAYERAGGYLPTNLGEVDKHRKIVELDDYTSEPCPVFFNIYFERTTEDMVGIPPITRTHPLSTL